MGYTPKRRVFRLRFEDEEYDGLVVKVRSTSVGRLLEFMGFLAMDTDELTPADVEKITGLFEAFAEVLVEWNVQDDDGQPVPATLDGVRTQDADFVMAIMRVWFQAVTTAPAPLAPPSSAGAPSVVPPLPMEPLSPSRAS
jgi:hypothetical protein